MDKPKELNGYDLSRKFINWAFENPSRIKPNHYALYFFSIEHCNRLGWKQEFGLPSVMSMEATGIKSHNTYMNTFNDLIEFGFFNCIERSKNQYSSNIIALSNFDKASNKALDKASIKHVSKQSESTIQSIDNINKQTNNKQLTIKQTNNSSIQERKLKFADTLKPFIDEYGKELIKDFYLYWSEHGDNDKKMKFEKQKSFGITQRLRTWKKNDKKFNNGNKQETVTERNKRDSDESTKRMLGQLRKDIYNNENI